jgi:hypothetical protein
MEADTIYPMLGITKELNLQFVLGYTQDEFAATLGHIARARSRPRRSSPARRRRRVAQAFDELGSPSATPRSWCIPSADLAPEHLRTAVARLEGYTNSRRAETPTQNQRKSLPNW